jgi:putative membrane protein
MLRRKNYSSPKTLREYLRLLFTGFAMGTADTIPGVSGGTMAFILGVYEDLIKAIKSFDSKFIEMVVKLRFKDSFNHVPWQFLLALGTGILTAIFALSNIVSYLLENHPSYVFAFFGGLILASILAIGAQIEWSAKSVIALLVGTIGAYIIVGLNPPQEASHGSLTLFVSGMIAVSAMILPGISGSFILLILGQYEYVLNAVRDREFGIILLVGLGCAVGIAIASRILSYLLRNYYLMTIVVLTGFMLGSLRVIWKSIFDGHSQMVTFGTPEALLEVALAIGGFLLVSFLDHLATGRNPFFNRVWPLSQKEELMSR